MLASSRGPRAAAGVRGRDKSLPYDQRWTCDQPGSRNHPDGRRAGCPHPAGPCGGARSRFLKSPRCGGRERPPYRTGENIETNRENAAAQTPAGGYGIRPYETARSAANRGAAPSAVSQTSVGDDARIVPGTPRCRKARGRDKSLPYDQRRARGQPESRNHPDGRRAGCPHPAGPRAAANTHGRIWNPPLRNGKVCGQPGNRTLCDIANLCRGRCSHRPGDLAPPQGPREGYGPPLQTFRTRPAKPDSRNHPGGRRAGCPHPAGPCGKTTPEF